MSYMYYTENSDIEYINNRPLLKDIEKKFRTTFQNSF